MRRREGWRKRMRRKIRRIWRRRSWRSMGMSTKRRCRKKKEEDWEEQEYEGIGGGEAKRIMTRLLFLS